MKCHPGPNTHADDPYEKHVGDSQENQQLRFPLGLLNFVKIFIDWVQIDSNLIT